MPTSTTHFLILLIFLVTASDAAASAKSLDQQTILQQFERTMDDPDGEVVVTIDAPIDYVFGFLIFRLQDFAENVFGTSFNHADAAIPGAMGIGSERSVLLEDDETLLQRLLLFDPPHSYGYHVDMQASTAGLPLDYSISRYQLEEVDAGGTQLRVSIVYKPSSKLLGFVIRRAFQPALRKEFEKAAEIIAAEYESEHLASATADPESSQFKD